MLWSEWSQFLLISSFLSLFSRPLEIVASVPTPINVTDIFIFHNFFGSSAKSKYLPIFLLFIFLLCGHLELQNPVYNKFFSFCYLTLALVFGPRLSDPFVSQSPWEFCVFHFLGHILFCAYIIFQHRWILNPGTIHSRLSVCV